MTQTTPLTISEHYARRLLVAWTSGELTRLQSALDWKETFDNPRLLASEQERIEMVDEIAASIRLWLRGLNSKSQSDLQASLKLLRHLARTEDVSDESWIEEPAACA